MRDWKPKKAPHLKSAADWDLLEIQAATKRGLTPAQWREQDVDDRARMMACDFVENLHTGYVSEKQMAELEKKGKDEGQEENALDRMKRQWGLRKS